MIRARSSKQNDVTLANYTRRMFIAQGKSDHRWNDGEGSTGWTTRKTPCNLFTSSRFHRCHIIFFSDKFWPQAVRWPGLLYWSFFMHLVFYNHILAAPRCARDITKSRTVSSKRAVNRPTKRERLERFREYLTNGERVARDVVAAKTWGCIRDEGAPVDQGGRGLAQHGSGGRERTSKGQVQYDEKPFERSKKLDFAGWVVCPMVFLRAYPIFPENNFVWSLTLFNLFCNGTWEAVWPTRAAQTRPKTLGWASSRKDVGLASSSWLCDFWS